MEVLNNEDNSHSHVVYVSGSASLRPGLDTGLPIRDTRDLERLSIMSADGMSRTWEKANEYERLEMVLTCVRAGHLESALGWLNRDPNLNTFVVQLKTATDQIEMLENMLGNQIERLRRGERARGARVEEIRCARRAVLQAEIDERQEQIDERQERIDRLMQAERTY